MKKLFRILITALMTSVTTYAQKEKDFIHEPEEEFNKRMQWFTDAKYGMFIHLGLYSQWGGEWNGREIEGYAEWIQANADIIIASSIGTI